MNWGGVLAGALGGGAAATASVADDRIQMRNREAVMRLDAELDAQRAEQVARIKQQFDREQQTYNTVGQGGQEQLQHARALEDQRTAAEVSRAQQLGPIQAEQAAARETQVRTAAAEAARKAQADLGKDPAALAGIEAEARAKRDPNSNAASVASAAAARADTARQQGIQTLLDQAAQLRAEGRDEEADRIVRIAETKAGKASGKSYSDVVSAARTYADIAKQKQAILNDPAASADLTPQEKAELISEIRALQSKTDALLSGVAEKRGVPSKSEPEAPKDKPKIDLSQFERGAARPAPAPRAAPRTPSREIPEDLTPYLQ
jgi:hypothetical protein